MRSRIERPTAGIWWDQLICAVSGPVSPEAQFRFLWLPSHLFMPARCLCSLPRAHKYFNRASSYYFVPLVATLWLAGWLLPLLLSERRRPSAATTTTSFCSAVRVPTTFRSKVTDVARSVYSLPSYRLVRSVWDLSVGLICCPRALPDNDYSTVRGT